MEMEKIIVHLFKRWVGILSDKNILLVIYIASRLLQEKDRKLVIEKKDLVKGARLANHKVYEKLEDISCTNLFAIDCVGKTIKIEFKHGKNI